MEEIDCLERALSAYSRLDPKAFKPYLGIYRFADDARELRLRPVVEQYVGLLITF